MTKVPKITDSRKRIPKGLDHRKQNTFRGLKILHCYEEYAQRLQARKKSWIFRPKRFPVRVDSKRTSYTPTFYVPQDRMFVQVVANNYYWNVIKKRLIAVTEQYPQFKFIVVNLGKWQIQRARENLPNPCKIVACSSSAEIDGYCQCHQELVQEGLMNNEGQLLRRFPLFDAEPLLPFRIRYCAIAGCSSLASAGRYCYDHYT